MLARTSAFALSALLSLSAIAPARAATYNLQQSNVGNSFYTNFAFEAIADPTHGRVNYVNEATARSKNLTFASSDTFVLRTDFTTRLSAGGAGRDSVRLLSRRTWGTHVTVIDMRHMPQGCGTWPAVWELGPNWPYGGEVDIVEGVNDKAPNQVALHTDGGCYMASLPGQTGTLLHNDCNSFVDGNTGCTVQFDKANSYGPGFNNNGGGVFVMERTSTFIKVWFWPRNQAPAALLNGAASIDTGSFGTPIANYNNAQCPIANKFAASNIVINLTLCGDWAGNPSIWAQSACAAQSDCATYVNNNPAAFRDAYFDFRALRVYA